MDVFFLCVGKKNKNIRHLKKEKNRRMKPRKIENEYKKKREIFKTRSIYKMYNVISLKRHTYFYMDAPALQDATFFFFSFSTQFVALHFDQKYDVALSH